MYSINAPDILSHQNPYIIPSILISWCAYILLINPLLVEYFFTLKLRRPIRANLVRAVYRLNEPADSEDGHSNQNESKTDLMYSSLKIVIASNELSQFSNIANLATTEKVGLGKLSLANCLLRGEMLLVSHPIRGLKPIEFEPLKSL